MPVVELREVHVSFGEGQSAVSVLRGTTLTVEPDELVAVMGPSGSGKSTLLSVIGGLLAPTAGEVLVLGRSVTHMSHVQRAELRLHSLGYVFQEYNLIPSLTAMENVAMPLELAGRRAAETRRTAHAALAAVGLEGLGRRFPDELSGGERQRVAIARATVGGGRAVLADEPTGALDSVTAGEVIGLLREVSSAGIVVTHDPAVAARMDRIVHMRDGRCSDDDPETPLLGKPSRIA